MNISGKLLIVQIHPLIDLLYFNIFITNIQYLSTRGHNLKLEMPRSRTTRCLHQFSRCVIKTWNNLPKHIFANIFGCS